MSEPEISVVIPAHNAAPTLGATLACLHEQRFAGTFEVVVVDDGSTDETARLAEQAPVVDRVIRHERGGPARARNAGAGAAAAARLAFLDADCRPTADWLAAGDAALDGADLVVGETRPRPDQSHGPFDRSLYVVGPSPLFESANLFVRRELFERLGGFESWLGPRAGKELGEDVWFGWSAVRAGARVAACPEALVHHEVFARGPLRFAAERWRLRYFPPMAHRMPELRCEFFHHRYFLNARSARFDAAVLGVALAVATRRPIALAATAPYARLVIRDLRRPWSPVTATAQVAADLLGFAALLLGSVRSRSLLL